MKRDERTHIVPDDTIFNAPLGNSLGLLHSLMPIILSLCTRLLSLGLRIIYFIVVQFTLGTVAGGARCG